MGAKREKRIFEERHMELNQKEVFSLNDFVNGKATYPPPPPRSILDVIGQVQVCSRVDDQLDTSMERFSFT